MTTDERVAFTLGLARSGRTLDWGDLDLPGPLIDKHSSGGVGDKVSLVLAPIAAACGSTWARTMNDSIWNHEKAAGAGLSNVAFVDMTQTQIGRAHV